MIPLSMIIIIKPYNNNNHIISCVIYLYTIILIVLKDIPSIQFFKNDLYYYLCNYDHNAKRK